MMIHLQGEIVRFWILKDKLNWKYLKNILIVRFSLNLDKEK